VCFISVVETQVLLLLCVLSACPAAAAAVLRQIYVRQGLGVGQLRMKFGGLNKRKGAVPEHFAKSSGGLIRHIMKQFEAVGFVEKHTGEQGGG
jgi:small subunit ribosomal protein S19e